MLIVVDRDPGDEHPDPARAGVVAHRMRRLMRIGYCEALALQIAESDVDVREIARLVDAGCPLPTAARILL